MATHIHALAFRSLLCAALTSSTASALASNDAMLELLKVLRDNGTIDEEAYELIRNAALADAEQSAAAGEDIDTKVRASLAAAATPSLSPGKFEVKQGDFTWRVGGRLMYDANFWDDDGAFTQDDAGQFRRARMNVTGTLFNSWKYKFEYDFADMDRDLEGLKDAYVEYTGLSVFEKPLDIKAGQSHEPFSFEVMSSSNNSLFVERSMPATALGATAGERNPGLKLTSYGEVWTASFGAFANKQVGTVSGVTTTCTVPAGGLNPGDTLRCTGTGGDDDDPPRAFEDGYALTGRGTYAPWHDGGHVLHLGAAFSYRDFADGSSLRFRERPEVNVAPRIVDTGNFAADDFWRLGTELVVIEGPFTLQAEYLRALTNTAAAVSDPRFDGYYLSAGWFLTGESRPYKFEEGIFDSVRPNHPVGKGGIGAWELALRFSHLDLSDDAVDGGETQNLTVGLNWYPISNVRFMADYVRVLDVDGGTFDGAEPAALVVRSHVFW